MHCDETEDTKTDSIIRWISTASNWESYYLRAIKRTPKTEHCPWTYTGTQMERRFFSNHQEAILSSPKVSEALFCGHGLASIFFISIEELFIVQNVQQGFEEFIEINVDWYVEHGI